MKKLLVSMALVLIAISGCSRAPVSNPPLKPAPLKPVPPKQVKVEPENATPEPIEPETTLGISMVAVGDISLGRKINAEMVARDDFIFPFEHVMSLLKTADIAVGNLEAQIFARCPVLTEGMRLCASPKAVAGLVHAGIDVVSVANNHAGNFGDQALAGSVQRLRKNGISVAGYDRPPVIEREGKKFAFLAYNMTRNAPPNHKVGNQIAAAAKRADFVVLLLHWGKEYELTPSKAQIEFAHYVVAQGADLVIGAHPHVIQPVAVIDEVPVIYSLGNFVFDQETEPDKTTEGAAAVLHFSNDTVTNPQLIPVKLVKPGIPTISSE